MKLSDQAIGAIMMALQRSIMDFVDVTQFLKDFDFYTEAPTQGELFIRNPPILYKDEERTKLEEKNLRKEIELEE